MANLLHLRKTRKESIDILYQIALRSFEDDYDKYGVYPPLLDIKKKKFIPQEYLD